MKKLLLQLWRAWFYIVAGIPVLILFPFLVFILLLPNAYPIVFWIARNIWAPIILTGCGFYTKVRYAKPLPTGTSYVLVANHTSYIDPFVMLRVSKNPFVFVGKKELVNIPFFGYIYKRAAIMVDRSDKKADGRCMAAPINNWTKDSAFVFPKCLTKTTPFSSILSNGGI